MTQTSPSPGGLSISSSIEGGVASLALRGELDLASAPLLERSLLELAANTRARKRGGELVLRPGDANVQRVFDVTGALEVLRFEDAVGS
jgi:anti-anti-sigma regulatory factor